jgi:PAS domain S-box-containing protein
MAGRDLDSLAALAADFLSGRRPSGPEEALVILGLLSGSGRSAGDDSTNATTSARTDGGTLLEDASPGSKGQLQLAEARYRALVEQIPAVVFLASLERGFNRIYVNPQIEALLGFTQKEWTSDPVLWFRQLHPEDRADVSREFASACITGRPFQRVLRVYSHDGTLKWVHAEARLVRDEAGHPLFLHGLGFDVTEQQRAEQTKRQLLFEQAARDEAERDGARLRDMFTNLPAAISILNGPEHVIEFFNPAAFEMAGVGAEVIGKSWRDVFPDLPRETAMLDRVFATGEPFSARDWSVRSPRWPHERFLNFVCQPVRDRRGAVTGLLTHIVEVTEQRLAQAATESASRRASLLASVSQVMANSLDYRAALREVALLVVPGFADVCGVEMVGAEGVTASVALVSREPAAADLAQRFHASLLAVGPSDGIGHVLRTGDAVLVSNVAAAAHRAERTLASAEVSETLGIRSFLIVPIPGRDRVHGALFFAITDSGRHYGPSDRAMAEDIAQRAAIAIDNARLYREAQEASRLKDEFLATLSHELRTPLNAIVGWAHILRARAVDTHPDVVKGAEVIVRNAYAQSQLISDILDVSRIIAGKLAINLRPLDLTTVIEAALETVQPAAQAKEIRLEQIVDASAGPVSGDPDRLQQVVWNLLSNAIKFSPKGGRVQIRLEAINSHVEIVVEDNGPGIQPDFLPFIFERFRQEDSSSTRRHGGLGLGLAIVRHLVELHGGTVEASNSPQHSGAVFKIQLPRRSLAAVERVPPLDRHPQAEETVWLDAAPSLAGMKVLVVDDEPDARELVATALGRCGAEAVAAASAAAAYDALRSESFDVLLVDIEMPDVDGYDFIRRLRSLPAEQGGSIPAAALTAYASAQDRIKVLAAGFQIHVAKPVQPAELAAVVASLAAQRANRG